MTNISHELHELLLAFADDELCVGQNHAHWIAVSPFLEEDLAFTSIAQDELGHARTLYQLLTGPDTADRLAYLREPGEYRCAHIAELNCHEWAHALVRHVLHDLAERVRWDALVGSSHAELAAIAQRSAAEEWFHLRHGVPLLQRLLSTETGRERLVPVIEQLAPMGSEYFLLAADDGPLVASGSMTASLDDQLAEWRSDVEDVVAGAGADIDWSAAPTSGRQGQRSVEFAPLHDEMVAVLTIDPTASW